MYAIDTAQKTVREFFCPEIAAGALGFNNPVAYDVQDRCRAAGITTVAQLINHTEADLRSKSFSSQHLELITAKLAKVGHQLLSVEQKAFRTGARGVVAVCSISQPEPLPGYASPWIMTR